MKYVILAGNMKSMTMLAFCITLSCVKKNNLVIKINISEL